MAHIKLFRLAYLGAILLIVVSFFSYLDKKAEAIQDKVSSDLEKGVDSETSTDSGSSDFGTNSIEVLNTNTEPTELQEDGENTDETIRQNSNEIFSWTHHQDDHGIYSGRSLMSTANIKQNLAQQDDDHLIDELDKKKLDEEYPDPLKTIDYVEKEWQLMFRALDQSFDSMSSSVLQQISEQTNVVNDFISKLKPDCRREIYHVRDSAQRHKLWALRMLDSNGKLPSGITYGRYSSPGDFEECLSINIDETVYTDVKNHLTERHKFHGKYCLIDFRLPMPERPHDRLLSIHEPVLNLTGTAIMEKFPAIYNYSAYASVFYEIGYMHAFCLPSTCDIRDVTKSLNQALEGLHIIVNNTVDCEERPYNQPVPLRKSQIISLYLIGFLFLNAACASLAHYMLPKATKSPVGGSKQQQTQASGGQIDKDGAKLKEDEADTSGKPENGKFNLRKWLNEMSAKNQFYSDCFSVQKNFERLTKPDPRGLTVVHYTRIVAMALTVITHTAGLGTLQAITKPADTSNSEQIFRDFIPQMLANAFTSIQIFFFMAGFMLVISTYPSIKRDNGHLSFLEYATKRAIRLMPGIAATICLNFLWPLIVDGPMLSYFIRIIVIPCESTWWRTLGFLSNFDHVEKICIRHSYFSASDYQLHLMAFPLLIMLYKQPTLSLCLAGLLTLSGFIAQVIMILTKLIMPFMMVDYIDKEAFFNVVHYIHHPVWNHISAFFCGFIVGYLVVKQIRVNWSRTTIRRIWIILMPLGIASIFAPYFWNHYKRPIYKWQMVLYVIIDRFILLTTCAWLSYATMVLGRKPSQGENSKRRQSIRDTKQSGLNLPNVVVLEAHKQNKDKLDQPSIKAPSPSSTVDKEQNGADEDNLKAIIPRQRSSPDFHNLQPVDSPRQMSKAISSTHLADVATTQTTGDAKQQPTQKAQIVADENSSPKLPEASPVPKGPSQQQPRRNAPPISNVNTLCLILSRLTFQLYLFNMVVLWVDVNNSKYHWFFSYYFIITKAAAIYICSALMATIFFITLESPCLTLYIAWVKSRATARAKRQSASNSPNVEGQKNSYDADTPVQVTTKQSNTKPSFVASQQVNMNPAKLSPGPDASAKSQLGGSFDGLCMRTGTSDPVKPTFSYIDLSTLTSAQSSTVGERTASNNNQTKM